MDKRDKCQTVRKYLIKLECFMAKFLPVANAHNCDFITDCLWENLIPKDIADELLSLTKENLSLLPLGKLYDDDMYEEPFAELNETNMNNIDTVLSHCFPKEDALGHDGLNTKKTKAKWDKSLKPVWDGKGLKEFVKEVNLHKLTSFQVNETRETVLDLFQNSIETPYHISHGMNAKKSHEIEIMTHLCAAFAKFHNIDVVVDIGSGKGYLGCQLAMTHQLQVLGIDSSNINTKSAQIRTKRVQKHWNGLVRNVTESKSNKECNNEKINESTDTLSEDSIKNNRSDCKTDGMSIQTSLSEKSNLDTKNITNQVTNKDLAFNRFKKDVLISNESHFLLDVNSDVGNKGFNMPQCRHSEESNKDKLYIPVTEYVTSDTDLLQLIQNNFHSDIEDSILTQEAQNTDTDGINQHEEASADVKLNNCEKHTNILLTGLHTCGDLASNILRLFLLNKDVVAMCNVGCCYHLIEEEFLLSPYSSSEDAASSADEAGFPLSRVLRRAQFQLGRNARMLACQAPDRLVEHAKLPDRSLYWRALLQVILRDITGTIKDDWHVGRIAAKCSDFKQYIRKALSKLDIHEHLNDEEIEQYENKYGHYQHKLNAFFQLKTLLAPCIEAMILLDRLLFLLEEECTENAYLVQLFDTVKSPRCYALIAVKRKEEQ